MAAGIAALPGRFVRDRATWLTYFLSLYYAYVINILGPLTPFLRSELRLDYTQASLHFSSFALGMLVAGATAERVVARVGRRRTLWTGACGMAAGLLVLIAGRQPLVTVPACFVMGTLGTWILGVYPAVLADRHGAYAAVAFTEGTVMGGIGAAAAPFLLGLLARTALGWRTALLLPVLALVPIYLAFRSEQLAPRRDAPADQAKRAAGKRERGLPAAYWGYWAVLVSVVAVEFCIAFWIADFLQTERGLQRADAALAATLFLFAMLVGRIVGSRVLHRVRPPVLLYVSLGLTLAGFLVFWQVQALAVVAAGLFVAGLGVANLYPTTLALAVGAAPGQVDQASARGSLASGAAILGLPLLLGRVADSVGITPAFALVGVLTALAALLLFAVRAINRKNGRQDLGDLQAAEDERAAQDLPATGSR